jgi:hypothetical protein
MKSIAAIALTIALSFFLVTAGLADDKAVQKYRDYTPEQIRDIPAKQRESEVPMMYIFAARQGLTKDVEVVFAMQLNRLMYSGVHDYKAAVRAFQADLGDKPTGVLTVWQIHTLEQRSEMQRLSRVLFPQQFASFKTDDYAVVEGTVTLIDEQIAWPINHVKLTCSRRGGECRADQIDFARPNAKSWSQNYQVMYDSENYTITGWDKDTIDARFERTANACRTTSLNLNFKTKEFFYITRNAGGDCQVLGVTFENLPKPRIAQIIDGSKIIAAEFATIEKAAYDVLASDFRRKVDQLAGK